MKKVLFGFLLITICFLLTSCFTTIMLYGTIQEQSVSKEIKENIINKGYPIVVTWLNSSYPNSAGGVDVDLVFRNLSSKDIKYADFWVVPYNAVDDIQICTVRRQKERILSITGPIQQNTKQAETGTFRNVWYNYDIKRVELVKLTITFMDDTEVSYDKEQCQEMCKSYYIKN